MVLKDKDKNKDKPVTDTDNEVVCGAPTPALARHIPNDETLRAIQDVVEGRDLYRSSFEEFEKELLGQ